MVANPCCCGWNLQTSTRIVAICDMVMSTVSAISVLALGAILITSLVNKEGFRDDPAFGQTMGFYISIFALLLVLCLAKLWIGWILKKGAEQENFKKCKIWLVVNCLASLGFIAIGVVCIVALEKELSELWIVLGAIIAALSYQLFCLGVVIQFMRELRSGKCFYEPNNVSTL